MPEIGGAWNYIQNLLQALARVDRSDSFVAFVTRESEVLVPDQANFERIRVGVRSSFRTWRIAYENTAFCALAGKHRLDCLHWFSNIQAVLSSVPSVVTFHDLQPFYRLAPHAGLRRLYLKLMMTQTARRAQVLLPVSEATAAGLTDILGIDPARMSVIHTVLGDEFRPAPAGAVAAFRERYRLPERFLLYVAHLFPHKNHLRLLDAYAMLGAAGPVWPLVFRGDAGGAEDKIHSRVRDLGLEKSVSRLPRLGARDMGLLYSAASAFVFPSLFEGGGIPVVEAMACGLPLAASRIPSVVEFAGPAALFFNPLDVTSIAAALERLMNDPGRLEIMRRAGLARAENFRPDAVIPQLLQAYGRAAARR